MSSKREDKTKLYRKLHQLQKRFARMRENPGHSESKEKFRLKVLRVIKEKINGKTKKR
jgi:hypothetical protein